MVTTRMRVTELTDEGQQAGLVLWQGENPNTFAKIVYINKGTTRRFEYVATRDGAQDIQAGPTFSASAREAYLRVRTNGNGTYIAEGSLDGDEWMPIASPISGLGDPETLKVGIKASDGSASENAARFAYFRVDCSDRVAPETTASVSPGEPDGQLGWYRTAPTVTLAADDGPFGGISRIQYKIDDGPTRTYTGPFTLSQAGDHVVEYFATDDAAEPNVAPAQTLGLRVDANAPRTVASLARPAGADGPVEVTLDPQDGSGGSGAVLTQYRVDGGPWRAYQAKDQQLLDDSAASLAQWAQAGAGSFERLDDGSGGITPVGGLGMLWYPVEQFGDFKLKFQFREGRTDGGLLQRRRIRALSRPARAGRAASRRVRQDGQRGIRPGLGRDLLRSRDPALRRNDRRAAEDGVDLQLRPERHRRDRRAERGRRVERLRGRGRRPALHDPPQRRRDQRVRERARDRVVARRRPVDVAAPVRAGLRRVPEPRRGGHDAVPRRPGPGPVGGRAGSQSDRQVQGDGGRARTRSSSARSTRPATSSRRRRPTSRSGRPHRRRQRRRAIRRCRPRSTRRPRSGSAASRPGSAHGGSAARVCGCAWRARGR